MTVAIEQKKYTPQEYLDLETDGEERHDYMDGDIVLMPGGTPNHNRIALNLAGFLNFTLKRQPYDVFIADQRLWIPQKRIYTYPDVIVVRDDIQFQEGRNDTIVNPLIIVEVLSPSTRSYDKGDKFAAYRTIPGFCEYLLIEQDIPHVEHYLKTDKNQWLFSEYDGIEASFEFGSIESSIDFSELYDKVRFE
ncbi:MAG: Uma2 family endonuclease [Cyanobacteria bacterium SID2]|nr:Uma2 family endonuclease [Cyanobacteria bacterium SID2]MBP0005493.1 Uma2 family endonuclease [Cyanobacteria bacterium SBC]